MYYAIIDAKSDISRLVTVAYGARFSDIAEWFADELKDTYEMYADGDENSETLIKQCRELTELAREDAVEKEDLEGLAFAVADISVELFGIYDTYEQFKGAFCDFVKDKPKYVKIKPENDPSDIIAECDRLNSLLIRASI